VLPAALAIPVIQFCYNQSNGRELLKKIIIREGLLRIQAGDTPRNVLICTKVFLGKVDDGTFRNP
jgi:chemotaxis protein MotA